jgi:urease accessory protein
MISMRRGRAIEDLARLNLRSERLLPNNIIHPPTQEDWLANLSARFEKRGDRTILAEQSHTGPLLIQKALYPEGSTICHTVVVHPPGGIAEGDKLSLNFEQGPGTHAVITTPAATKWYKAPNRPARQRVSIKLAAGAKLDWLPQENILFDRARVEMSLRLSATFDATAIGWDLISLGRYASGEKWLRGSLLIENQIADEYDLPHWIERAMFEGASPIRNAPQGLAGFSIFGTLWAFGAACTPALAESLALELPFEEDLRAGASCLPGGVLLIRALSRRTETLRNAMISWWSNLRPLIHGVPARPLRLWAT